jgi:Fe-S cluster assembly ATP-binding protein
MLNIHELCVSIDATAIIKNISLTIKPGMIHAIMGPNGSGKSTLAHAIAGNPQFRITSGTINFNTIDIIHLAPHERAQKGIFLSFQQPPAIPGLTVFSLLKEIYYAVTGDTIEVELLHAMILGYCQQLALDVSFLNRSCHDGFSGGEKKRLELLQLLLLKPKLIILDEIDSGLDIDALKLVARVITLIRQENPETIVIIITHYQRLLAYIKPDKVHILLHGTIIKSGSSVLVRQLEQKGYDGYRITHAS